KPLIEGAIKKVEKSYIVYTLDQQEVFNNRINEEIQLSFAMEDSVALAASNAAANTPAATLPTEVNVDAGTVHAPTLTLTAEFTKSDAADEAIAANTPADTVAEEAG